MESEVEVAAVIVTFNRYSIVERLLGALVVQARPADAAYVVDNRSRDETGRKLSERAESDPWIKPVLMAENTGPAGGFAAGINAAMASDPDYLWLMDDDCVPDSNCLEVLLGRANSHPGHIVYPGHPTNPAKGIGYGWWGCLVPSEAVRRAGVPLAELFWWIEDTEYLLNRLERDYKYPVTVAPTARVLHGDLRDGEKAWWKFYYEARNTIYYRFYVQIKVSRKRRFSRAAIVIASLVKRAVVERQALLKTQLVAKGVLDGFRGRLGKRIDPELPPS